MLGLVLSCWRLLRWFSRFRSSRERCGIADRFDLLRQQLVEMKSADGSCANEIIFSCGLSTNSCSLYRVSECRRGGVVCQSCAMEDWTTYCLEAVFPATAAAAVAAAAAGPGYLEYFGFFGILEFSFRSLLSLRRSAPASRSVRVWCVYSTVLLYIHII